MLCDVGSQKAFGHYRHAPTIPRAPCSLQLGGPGGGLVTFADPEAISLSTQSVLYLKRERPRHSTDRPAVCGATMRKADDVAIPHRETTRAPSVSEERLRDANHCELLIYSGAQRNNGPLAAFNVIDYPVGKLPLILRS